MQDVIDLEGIYVVKIGSSTLVDAHGEVDEAYIFALCQDISDLMKQQKKVIVVSSGAVAAGMKRLGLSSRPHDIPTLQAAAAAGQAVLTEVYAQALASFGISSGQVLLTRRDLCDRAGYLNARTTLGRLLELGAVPIINENDTTSVAEFTFGDNDTLGAIVSTLVHAERYIIFTDVDGLYTANPQLDPGAQHIDTVHEITPEIIASATGSTSLVGTGGMSTKIFAAQAAMAAGIPTIICNGRNPHALAQVAAHSISATTFEPKADAPSAHARNLWIGLAGLVQGAITIDDGAKEALLERSSSLLPVGITQVTGSFQAGDVVNVCDSSQTLLARGIIRYSSDELLKVRGLKLTVIARFMPDHATDVAIHKDEMLLF